MIVDSFCFAQNHPSEQGLLSEMPVSIKDLKSSLASQRHICLFNSQLQALGGWLDDATQYGQVGVTGLIPAEAQLISQWREYSSTFTAFVIHPYLQNLNQSSLAAIKTFLCSDDLAGRPVFVCTAIGSQKLYTIDPLKIAAEVASWVSSPVILAHCGGAKIIEAFLLADAYPHVFLETSFSLAFWQGSSVEQDIAFAMKKLGAERWLYGSDAPYCDEQTALNAHQQFFDHFGFDQNFQDGVMGRTAKNILSISR